MSHLTYTLLIHVAAPLAFAALLWRGLRDPVYRERRAERFGFARARCADSIWVHAVSVGEVQAAAVLVRELRARYPQHPLVVTTGTPTGAERVRALFGDTVQHVYLPYDLPGAVRRFLDRIRPRVGVIVETEVWPNLFAECARRRIPLLIASARLSQKSVRGYRWLAGPFKCALASGIQIAAQTRADAERFIAVGADPAKTQVIGNIKFDLHVDETVRARGRALRAEQFSGREVWVAGSTHAGEEQQVLQAHEQLRRSHPRALLVLVPRHPQRFGEVEALLRTQSIEYVTRSSQMPLAPTTSVLLVDAMGELMTFYAAGDAAFVGGSLVPIGGHSLLEPAALSLPVLTGPHYFNASAVAQALLESGGAIEVRDAQELAQALRRLFDDPALRERYGAAARRFVTENRGALARLLALLERLLCET